MAYIKGLDKLMGKLDKLENNKEFIRESLEESCLLVEGEAKENCPVKDGQLRQSITSEVEDYVGVVGTNVEYAPYVHQGTGIYAVNGDGRKTRWSYQDEEGNWHSTIGQQPNPFLEKALDDKRGEVLDVFKKKVGGTIKDG